MIIYDKAAMFTLWQLNVAICDDPNEKWHEPDPSYNNFEVLLDPAIVRNYLDNFQLTEHEGHYHYHQEQDV